MDKDEDQNGHASNPIEVEEGPQMSAAEQLLSEKARERKYVILDVGDTQEKIELELGEFDLQAASTKVIIHCRKLMK